MPALKAGAAVAFVAFAAELLLLASALAAAAAAAAGCRSSSTPLLDAVAVPPATSTARTLAKTAVPAGAATLALKMLVETPTLVQTSRSAAPGAEPTAHS